VPGFQLHLVTQPQAELATAVERALAGGVDWVQLRDKDGSALAQWGLARRLQALTRAANACLSINDRLDVALALGAEGVHLAGQSLPVAPAAELAAGRVLVGRSVHGLDEAIQAARDGADYLTFGHVFPSSSKPGLPPRGLGQLAAVVEAVDVPVLAIGGITLTNLDSVLATGCAGIAVISAILSARHRRQAAAALREALDRSPSTPRFPLPVPGQGGPHARHRQPAAL
jgi:thiamine-phosphate pyrophosphorylase